MHWRDAYEQWLHQLLKVDPLRASLEAIQDDKQLEDAFYKDLEFGTGGMRGILGPGTNRMNVYTVRKAAFGLGAFIASQGEEAKQRGVAIAYDSRHQSQEFAMEVAKTIGRLGVKSYVCQSLRPTPLLSFAVRHLNAAAGVMITASHNPPEYNGLKMYGEDGAQLPPNAADVIVQQMKEAGSELLIQTATETELIHTGLLEWLGGDLDEAYLRQLKAIQMDPKASEADLTIVFTGLHGTGTIMAEKAFDSLGFRNITYVEEQSNTDPDFTTAPSPNPEEANAFQLAIEYGRREGADLLLATDPDADRLGAAVRNPAGDYTLLTGNQIGAILIQYILEQKQQQGILPSNGVVMKTIVTTELARSIATQFGMETIDTLTGFKFIAEKIKEYKETNEHTFLFGFEESYGFLAGNFVRDKDAIQTTVLMSEAASHYARESKTLLEVLEEIYHMHGYHLEATRSIKLEGKEGAEEIQSILSSFRNHPPKDIADLKVEIIEDYHSRTRTRPETGEQSELELPQSNVLKFTLEDGSWICIRPSGTEPKIKFYFGMKAADKEAATQKLFRLEEVILKQTAL